jgi:hypothetical protein
MVLVLRSGSWGRDARVAAAAQSRDEGVAVPVRAKTKSLFAAPGSRSFSRHRPANRTYPISFPVTADNLAVKKRRARPAKKAKSTKWSKADEASYQDFLHNSGIKEVVQRLKALEAEAEALGYAPLGRGLLTCGKCGLFEGVVDCGLLYTAKYRNSKSDTGLRFTKIKEGWWRCPSCRCAIAEPEFKVPPDFFK